ncbi:hypothetical protein LTR37_004726 [Vermiconidia calcicola]|uniref:Uncharacterized protein n=1 Tax=Vermiconidia calcicola TaxID=1690605 RepID=A0ACC3NL83_9PEZI|nr:hypothetical protein LTR37_004726 [Vermiconidia calcicola]
MSRTFRRLASTTSHTSAFEAAAEILQRFGDKPISVREQLLDANQARLLSLTLGRPKLHENDRLTANGEPLKGTPLPAGYHWAYFTPRYLEKDLGIDGTDKTLNPLAPWTRRMWAGGTLEWKQMSANLLRVGSMVTEITRIKSAEAKQMKSGDWMILAGLEKTFESDNGVALIDKRQWVFQHELTQRKQPPPKPEEKPFPEGTHTRDLIQTEVSLFRFSALTFNAHKVHYSRDWCHNVEGHRDLVVHGPVNLLSILDFYRDVTKGGEAVPRSVAYRAMSPVYAGEKYRILLEKYSAGEEEQRPSWKAEIVDSFGKTCVKASIVD